MPSDPYFLDVAAERAATPGCEEVVHLNNAGAALPTAATVQAEVDHLWLEARRGGYEAAAMVADRVTATRAAAARLVGAAEDEVVLAGSDTQGFARALWGFVLGGGVAPGDRILTDRLAYDSHYMALLQVAGHVGAAVEVVRSETGGDVDLEALDAALSAGPVALCTATHVGTHRGLVNPVEEMGAACRAAGVPFFLDACQSVGQLAVDVDAVGCDVLTTTGRKWLRGPRGTGFLYVRQAMAARLQPPGAGGDGAVWLDADRFEFRAGAARFAEFEVPVAAQVGLGVALDHVLELGVDAISVRVGELAARLRRTLGEVDGVSVHESGRRLSGIVAFTVEGTEPAGVKAEAAQRHVNVSVSEAPAARLDMATPRPAATVRASPHYYNTDAELDALVEVARDLAAR